MIQSFDKYLLSNYYVPGTALDARDTLVDKSNIPALHGGGEGTWPDAILKSR